MKYELMDPPSTDPKKAKKIIGIVLFIILLAAMGLASCNRKQGVITTTIPDKGKLEASTTVSIAGVNIPHEVNFENAPLSIGRNCKFTYAISGISQDVKLHINLQKMQAGSNATVWRPDYDVPSHGTKDLEIPSTTINGEALVNGEYILTFYFSIPGPGNFSEKKVYVRIG